jgi:hypothetical protein
MSWVRADSANDTAGGGTGDVRARCAAIAVDYLQCRLELAAAERRKKIKAAGIPSRRSS